jgi:Tol biopolymer transport system component
MLINPRRHVFNFLLVSLFVVACASTTFTQSSNAVPGANGRIAFVSVRDRNAEIYTANPDGTNQTRLTNTPAQELTPAWSPDGTRLAFTSVTATRTSDGTSVNATADIYIINADGSGLRRLTNNSAYNTAPTWSPDGTRIAFSRSTIDPQIFLSGNKPGIADLLSASADIYVIGRTARMKRI